MLRALQDSTVPGGWNVVTVFTTRVPIPPDMLSYTPGPFAEGELARLYAGWSVDRYESNVFEDEHRGGVRHRHAVEKLVARR